MISDEGRVLLDYGNRAIYVDCDGIVRKIERQCYVGQLQYCGDEPLIRVIEAYGCHLNGNHLREERTLEKYINKSFSEYEEHLKKRADLYQKRRQSDTPTQRAKLDQLMQRFGGIIVGVDRKEIDVFSTGFRVALLFNALKPYSEQKEYLRKYFAKCRDFVLEQVLMSRNKTAKAILPVCKLQEVVMTRRNEAVFVFEIDDRIRFALET